MPTPAEIIDARQSVGLTQTQAAELIDKKLRQWQYYETGGSMLDPILWQVWRIRAGLDDPGTIIRSRT